VARADALRWAIGGSGALRAVAAPSLLDGRQVMGVLGAGQGRAVGEALAALRVWQLLHPGASVQMAQQWVFEQRWR
jgi:hypothetical protein